MRRLLPLLLFAGVCSAQFPANPTYCVRSTSSGAGDKVTVSQPATGAKNVRAIQAYVECVGGCTVTVSQNGTAATSTAATPVQTNADRNGAIASTAKAWSASNVGTGTTISTVTVAANGNLPLPLNLIQLDGNGTTKNFTVGHNNASGAGLIEVCYEER